MKKIMLSTVILLPIAVLLVLLVSSSIIGSTAHIYVDSVAFADEINEIRLKFEDESEKPFVVLNVEIYPLNARNKGLVFESEDESIVKIDAAGRVEAVDYGETFVKVSSVENPAKSDRKKVIVYDDTVHRLEWITKVDNIYVGKDADLEVKVIPKEAINQRIEWDTSDPDIIEVTPFGRIHAVNKGEATITARSADNLEVYIDCIIKAKPVATGIVFADEEETDYSVLETSETYFPEVKLLPEGTEEKISYTSSDESVATIDEYGHIIFSRKGTVTFTASVNENIKITKKINYNGGYFTLLQFSKEVYTFNFDAYPEGEILPIELTGYPLDTKKEINISYSKEGVIAVDGGIYNGKFYSVAPYEFGVLVTASTESADGNFITASCFVYLSRQIDSITVSQSQIKASDGICETESLITVFPENYTYSLVYSVDDETTAAVSRNGVVTFFKPGKVEVTVASSRSPEISATFTVESDTAFVADSIGLSFDEDIKDEVLVTSLTEYSFTVLVESGELSLESVDLGVNAPSLIKSNSSAVIVSESEAEGGILYYCKISFDGKGRKLLNLKLTEDGKITGYKSVVIESTFGTAQEIELSADGRVIEDGESFVIPDIGKSLEFVVTVENAPADFGLNSGDVKVDVVYNDSDASYLYDVDIEEKNSGVFQVRLSSVLATYNSAAKVTFTVGGVRKYIEVTNEAPANALEIYYNNTKLDAETDYRVFTDKTTLTLRAVRTDGIRVTTSEIVWQYGDESGTVANGKEIEFTVVEGGELTAENGTRSTTVSISKAEVLEDFGLSVIVVASGRRYEAAKTDSVKAQQSLPVILPASLQSGISLRIILPQYILGQLGEDTAAMTEILEATDTSSSLTIDYIPELNEIMLTPPMNPDGSVKSFDSRIELKYGEESFVLTLTLSDLKSIDLIGYDINDPNDVYKGLQQAGVYAKHSYYDGKETDYFKIPFTVDGNAKLLQWTMTEVVGENTRFITTQSDRTVIYNGISYTLNENGTLSDEAGKIVVGEDGKNPLGITFIDPFTEVGFARIWFGAVKGLTEEDIGKDNFGNFDETGIYNTANAPFVRIEATDGTAVISRHFNFNVAEDITEVNEEGAEEKHNLVNIVDKYGFIANEYIVLHTDLYGPEEKPDADEACVLDAFSDEEISTKLIYGNGHSVNYRQRSLNAIENNLGRDNVSVGRVYNTTLKGTTASTDNNEYRIAFVATKQLYCIVQACKEGMYGDGAELYAKNTIYRYIAESAIQLRAESKCTVENLIIVDCLKGLEMWYDGSDPDMGFYILGFLDVINYRNEDEPIIAQDETVNRLKSIFIPEIKKSGIEFEDRPDPANPDRIKFWANIVMASSDSTRFDKENSKENSAYDRLIHFGEDQKTNTIIPYGEDRTRKYGDSFFKDYDDGTFTWGLQRGNSMYLAANWFDIGVYTYMDRKDICIDCQLLDGDLPNTRHLAWHMNRAYRNTDLVGWHAEEHDENLLHSHADAA